MKEQIRLVAVEHARRVTEEDRLFLFELQRALLLELKEMGVLNDRQCQYAEERLRKQEGLPQEEK